MIHEKKVTIHTSSIKRITAGIAVDGLPTIVVRIKDGRKYNTTELLFNNGFIAFKINELYERRNQNITVANPVVSSTKWYKQDYNTVKIYLHR